MNQQFSKAQIWQLIGAGTIAIGVTKLMEIALQVYLTVQQSFEQFDQLKEQLGKEAAQQKPTIQSIFEQYKIYQTISLAVMMVLVGLIILVIVNRKNNKATTLKADKTSAPKVTVAEKKVETKKAPAKKTAAKKPAAKKAPTKKSTKK